LASEVPVFKPGESVTVAMNIMKKANNFIGIVMENRPEGILLANELLTRLV
jgi:ribosomal protein L19